MTESDNVRLWRSPTRGIARVALLVLLLGACGDDGTSATTTISPANTTTTGATVAPTPGDGAADALSAAIDAVGDSYAFTSTITVGTGVLSEVTGRISGDRGAYTVETGGVLVEYVLAPEGRWIRNPGGDWLRLDAQAPVREPLSEVRGALSVTDTGGGVFEALFDGATLGGVGGDIPVRLTVTDGRLSRIEFEIQMSIDLPPATVVTEIDADADVGTIDLPEA